MKRGFALASLLLALSCSENGAPSVEWMEGPAGENGRASHTLVLHNMPEGGRVWFQELYDEHQVTDGPVDQIHHYQGTSFYLDIPESGTLTIPYISRALPRHSWAPEGFVLQVMGRVAQVLPIRYKFLEHPGTPIDARWFAASYEPGPTDILPRIKGGKDKLSRPQGWYQIDFDAEGKSSIQSQDEDGAFYARVTLDKLPQGLKNCSLQDSHEVLTTRGINGFPQSSRAAECKGRFCLAAKSCPTLVSPWTVVPQVPLSMGFPRQEYWSGLPFPSFLSPGDLPEPGIKSTSPALAGGFWTTEPAGKPKCKGVPV